MTIASHTPHENRHTATAMAAVAAAFVLNRYEFNPNECATRPHSPYTPAHRAARTFLFVIINLDDIYSALVFVQQTKFYLASFIRFETTRRLDGTKLFYLFSVEETHFLLSKNRNRRIWDYGKYWCSENEVENKYIVFIDVDVSTTVDRLHFIRETRDFWGRMWNLHFFRRAKNEKRNPNGYLPSFCVRHSHQRLWNARFVCAMQLSVWNKKGKKAFIDWLIWELSITTDKEIESVRAIQIKISNWNWLENAINERPFGGTRIRGLGLQLLQQWKNRPTWIGSSINDAW